VAAIAIAWAAESAQFFIAQGFALAILAWLQTLPEFAVEAVLAWHQQVQFLLANLTGALRLLTGFGWPVIYFTAAMFQRKRGGEPLKVIHLEEHHAVEVLGLAAPLLYVA
jgi:cation:H+ antiporter